MAKSHSSKNSKAGRSYAQEIVTMIRAALSAALLIAAYSVNAASFISTLMLIAAALICGFDIILPAVDKIIKSVIISTISCLFAYAPLHASVSGAIRRR